MEETGRGLAEISDFSASINPLGPPLAVLTALKEAFAYLGHYPDPEARALTRDLARNFQVAPEQILAGNGSTELIHLLIRVVRPRKVFLPAPTFGEYAKACFHLQEEEPDRGEIVPFALTASQGFALEAEAYAALLRKSRGAPGEGLAFLCNPNNPTGGMLSRAEVMIIAQAAAAAGIWLIVDEAFLDFVPEGQSVMGEVKNNPYLVVLRSLTKIFALPALRLGFGIFPLKLRETLARRREPWTVNTLAQMAAQAALTDETYRERTWAVIAAGRERLSAGLAGLGFTCFPATANYLCFQTPQGPIIVAGLRKKGILVRSLADFPGLDETYLRIAVKSPEENERLLMEMTRLCAP
jgi:threonine-phosphate decarboxylase